jgi:hypothetical protein
MMTKANADHTSRRCCPATVSKETTLFSLAGNIMLGIVRLRGKVIKSGDRVGYDHVYGIGQCKEGLTRLLDKRIRKDKVLARVGVKRIRKGATMSIYGAGRQGLEGGRGASHDRTPG